MAEVPNNSDAAKAANDIPMTQPPRQNRFFKGDIEQVGSNALDEVIIPSVKKFLLDVFNNLLQGLFYGTGNSGYYTSTSYTNRGPYGGSGINYSGVTPKTSYTTLSSLGVAEFRDKVKAEQVLNDMRAIADKYGWVKVSDLLAPAGSTTPYTYEKYGWYSTVGAKIEAVTNNPFGPYRIIMPAPYLKNN